MLTVVPTLEIMKAVTDTNITGLGANKRREAFDTATDLISRANVDVLLEGGLYERVKRRLNEDQQRFMESIYKVDNSATGVAGYGSFDAIKWVAKAEARTRVVIILTENPASYQVSHQNIAVLQPENFIVRVKLAEDFCKRGIFTSFTDALVFAVMADLKI